MQARIDQIRKEAKELVLLLTLDECRELLMELPLAPDAGKTYRAVHQVLSDANTNDESKERADIFRKELRRHLTQKVIIMMIRRLNTREAEIFRRVSLLSLIESGSREGASEGEKMLAETLRDLDLSPSSPAPELYGDAIVFIADFLKPSQAALCALDRRGALQRASKGDSLIAQEDILASQARAALRDQSNFAQCSHFFRQTMQFNLKRLLGTLSYHAKRGNLNLIRKVLESFYVGEKTEDKKNEDKILLLKLLTETFTIEAYPDKKLTLMKLAYLEKNGRMCKMIKAAFMQFPDGIQLMQTQLSDPFVQSRNQEETLYNFTALVTAITTNTNVEAELVKFREDLAVIIAERGFPMTIFTQILNIFIASLDRPWTNAQYDTLFIQVFGGAQQMSQDWVKRNLAYGIKYYDNYGLPEQYNGERPFVLKGSNLEEILNPSSSIDPLLSNWLGVDYYVCIDGKRVGYGEIQWVDYHNRVKVVPVETAFKVFAETNATALANLTQAQQELIAPPPRASREPS